MIANLLREIAQESREGKVQETPFRERFEYDRAHFSTPTTEIIWPQLSPLYEAAYEGLTECDYAYFGGFAFPKDKSPERYNSLVQAYSELGFIVYNWENSDRYLFSWSGKEKADSRWKLLTVLEVKKQD